VAAFPLAPLIAVALLAAPAGAAPPAADTVREGTILIRDQPSGHYREETLRRDGGFEDKEEETIVVNRLGSRIEISDKESDEEDRDGHLVAGHSETSSSKTVTAQDYVIRGGKLVVTTRSGGRDYANEIALTGPLPGPAAVRRLMLKASAAAPVSTYQTFDATLGGVTKVTLKYLGPEVVGGVATRKFIQTQEGVPGETTIWVDADGYAAQMTADSPIGPVRMVRGAPASAAGSPGPAGPPTPLAGVELPGESFQGTIAISNIRLPHPRALESVTVELSKKPGAPGAARDLAWPNFASANQKILETSPGRLVLEISRPRDGEGDTTAPTDADTHPNAIVQSDDPQVAALARTIAAGETDPWRKALRLQAWVDANMHFDTGIALAPASEIVRDRHGTCLEYAVLLASLARAEGIPARMRMGYVYDEGVWGGHAWTEVFVHGAWAPIDAAEFYPGVADAGRIGAITVEGQWGALEHVGDLSLLFGASEVRTLGYRVGGRTTAVPRTAADHTVEGDVYANPWLGLRVTRPAGFAFAGLDAHWPRPDLLTLKSGAGQVNVFYLHAGNAPLATQLAAYSGIAAGAARATTWNGAPAIRLDSPTRAAMAAVKDDVMWAIFAQGPNAPALLDLAAAATSIDDLSGK